MIPAELTNEWRRVVWATDLPADVKLVGLALADIAEEGTRDRLHPQIAARCSMSVRAVERALDRLVPLLPARPLRRAADTDEDHAARIESVV